MRDGWGCCNLGGSTTIVSFFPLVYMEFMFPVCTCTPVCVNVQLPVATLLCVSLNCPLSLVVLNHPVTRLGTVQEKMRSLFEGECCLCVQTSLSGCSCKPGLTSTEILLLICVQFMLSFSLA